MSHRSHQYLLPRRQVLSTGITAFALLITGAACTGDTTEPEAGDPGAVAAELLRAATADLTGAAAVHWTGSFPSAAELRTGVYQVDVRTAGNGALLGTVTIGGWTAEVMAVSGHTLLRAGERFWRQGGVLDGRLTHFRNRWVVMYDGFFGFDLGARLNPGALLGGAAPGAVVTPATTTPEGTEIRWTDVTYLIADPTTPGATGTGLMRLTTTGTAESPARLDLRPVVLDGDECAELFSRLRVEAIQLIQARDHGSQPDQAGQTPPAFDVGEVGRIVSDLDRDIEALRRSATMWA
ncbi:hypothetical protein [Actinoplanes derwentensis]|uniref:Lipoprotein n=1 Tax=Actinoplanes derwentensis TaxID=113562 RepID=A0A1H2ARS7_9ACTN|nr:hypothetical protein [Actinoplanes derwentensis]GID84361.1 hypothetical protein Ade03nite_32850 [Actinoplanes derwentensis]SDT48644.1 hypothetical protein SAMN04489716_4048 [Actinoplanes derwentensis]